MLYAGRAPAAAPATGIGKIHVLEQQTLVAAALHATRPRNRARDDATDRVPGVGGARQRRRVSAAAVPASRDPDEKELMSTEIRVPQLPESVADATLVAWHKQPGDPITRDENLADLETDKVVLEVPAPANGVVREIRVQSGTVVTSGQVLAIIEEGAAPPAQPRPPGRGRPAARRRWPPAAQSPKAPPRTGNGRRRAR